MQVNEYTYHNKIGCVGTLDDLSLSYNGNQLKKVTDQCADLTYARAMDFKDGADKTVKYLWDANGNMTRDRNKKIWSIEYNVLNLPEEIIHLRDVSFDAPLMYCAPSRTSTSSTNK